MCQEKKSFFLTRSKPASEFNSDAGLERVKIRYIFNTGIIAWAILK